MPSRLLWIVPVLLVGLLAAGLVAVLGRPPEAVRLPLLLRDSLAPALAGLPQRVVPGAAGSVDLLVALLPPERLAALPEQALQYSALRDAASPYLRRPRFTLFGAEALLSADPDLVVAHDWQQADTIARLREAGIPVLVLPDPLRWEDARDQLLLLGGVLGEEARAREVVADLERRVAALASGAAGRAQLRALDYSNVGSGGWTAGTGTTADEVLRLAGLRNAAAEVGRVGHGRIAYEELLEIDPDLLVVASSEETRASATDRLLREEPALRHLRAVQGGRIVVLPAWLGSTTSQHLVTAAEHLAAAVDGLP